MYFAIRRMFVRKKEGGAPLSDAPLVLLDGSRTDFAHYRGNVLLVVNTASECGFTKQYAGLQGLQERFQARGFSVLAFPSNDFGLQEPGSAEQIQRFCELRFRTTFPIFAKGSVRGAEKQEFFRQLTDIAPPHHLRGEILWNFEKFLIDRTGLIRRRYLSYVTPKRILHAIEELL